eukprot:sb/3474548/
MDISCDGEHAGLCVCVLLCVIVHTRNWSDRTDRKSRENFSDRPRDLSLSLSLSHSLYLPHYLPLSLPLSFSLPPSLTLSLSFPLSFSLSHSLTRIDHQRNVGVIQMGGSALYIVRWCSRFLTELANQLSFAIQCYI